ncbi:sigma-70 family RNA polymerase sigma factor [Sporolactobacillus sp. THM7-7]|nr:sigma-70 family RNA polymerase sigma factor [Sporolactobacillus sp. THM7-7]
MPYTKLISEQLEWNEPAFEKWMKKVEPLIVTMTKRYAASKKNDHRSTPDLDDLIQIAWIAFWEAALLFDPEKVTEGKNPEKAFLTFAAKTIRNRLAGWLKKSYSRVSRKALIPVGKIDPVKSPRTFKDHLQLFFEDWLLLLSPSERQEMIQSLFNDRETDENGGTMQTSKNSNGSLLPDMRKKLRILQD